MKPSNRYKRVAFYVIAVISPFIIWLALEFIANSITHRFDPLKVDRQRKTLYLNQDYFTDFFLYDLEHFVNTSVSNRAIHLEKKNRFRIFCLGGSTTAGYPYGTLPEYKCPVSFPNYLRAILQYNSNLPEIEMLNLGSNAFNSLSVLKVFEDILKYNPDLVIVYTGHNEYFGPNEFALSKQANKVFTKKWLNNTFLNIRQTYLYQCLRWILKKVLKRGEVEYKDYAEWSLQNTIANDDPYHETVRNNFEKNITELVRLAKKTGIKVVLSTPISNLTFPPFFSRFTHELNHETSVLWDTLRIEASRFFDQNKYDDALSGWKQLYLIDSSFAEVHFYTGMNYNMFKEYDIANQALTRATDLDALPFRAKSSIREICRKIANRENIILADTDQFFRQLSGKFYPEPSLLLDHVHPTEPGYYYLALFLARTMVENGVFPGVKEIQYPTLEKTREALGIYDFVAYKIEYDFTKQSYLKQLSELNPAIKIRLGQIQEQALLRAKEIEKELFKEELDAKKLEEKN
ncbi:MAG: SGNH/GDSL hydrolase family protein [bacterium]|nr:SGNH/GDSL hydrolase family protein [bacterium]